MPLVSYSCLSDACEELPNFDCKCSNLLDAPGLAREQFMLIIARKKPEEQTEADGQQRVVFRPTTLPIEERNGRTNLTAANSQFHERPALANLHSSQRIAFRCIEVPHFERDADLQWNIHISHEVTRGELLRT